MLAQHRAVQLAQEGHCLQVFPAAVDIRAPFALLPAIIQIQHTGHSVHSYAVYVICMRPEVRTGGEEALHLGASEIKDPGAPVLVLPLGGVAVFVAARAIVFVQAKLILGEMRRYPIHDDTDAGLMQGIHQCHKVVRGAVAAAGGVVACHLVAPGAIIGVLGGGQQLHMGIAHFGQVGGQLLRQLQIGVIVPIGIAPPGTDMQLVDIHRQAAGILCGPLRHPFGIVPAVTRQPVDLAGVLWRSLGMESKWVRFIQRAPIRRGNLVFVAIIVMGQLYRGAPQALLIQAGHGVGSRVPAIKIPYHTDGRRVRCPGAEVGFSI